MLIKAMPIFIQVIFHIHISFLVYLEKFDSSKICPIWWLIWRQTIEMLVTNIYMTIVSKSVSFSVLANSNDIAINLMNSNKKLRNTHHPPTSNPRFPEHSTSNLIHGAHTLVPLSILLFLIHVRYTLWRSEIGQRLTGRCSWCAYIRRVEQAGYDRPSRMGGRWPDKWNGGDTIGRVERTSDGPASREGGEEQSWSEWKWKFFSPLSKSKFFNIFRNLISISSIVEKQRPFGSLLL